MKTKKIKQQKYTLFQIHTNDEIINMEVDKTKYDHFQTLSPLQQKVIHDMMLLEILKQKYGD
jgi:hypothetical protein